MKVSIVVLNWNGQQFLADCLNSLQLQTFKDHEVIVVDNGSTDGSQQLVRDNFPSVKLIELPKNVGFASGNNEGFAKASGEYIIALNNDTVADPGWLEEMVAVANANPGAGMLGCRICSYYDHDLIDSLGVLVCADGMSRGAFRKAKFSELTLERTENILLPSGCAAMYRKTMLDEIGFFDGDFFIYCEDTDLGIRGVLAGWKGLLARDAIIYHKYSLTCGALSPFKLYLVERNHYWMALRNFTPSMLMLLPFYTIVRFFEQARCLISSKGTGAEFMVSPSKTACIFAIVKAMFHGLTGIPAALAKRKITMTKRKISNNEFRAILKQYRLDFKDLLDAG